MLTGPDGRAPEVLIEALPRGVRPGDLRGRARDADADRARGDVVTTGDRSFAVWHLPGHTPGEIGLWEAGTRTLFSGDCVYESGELLDELPESNIADYVRSMNRLRDVPARIVHGGHDDAFGRERLLELIDAYVALRG
jgi:glyoxylase-like metal-dependent hydrolase (beta-lactamase superfamily II)